MPAGAIGPVGSGTHSLTLALLQLNDIKPGGETLFVDLEAEAAKALLNGSVDAIFLMGDSASPHWPPEQCPELLVRLDHIEREVNKMKVPASFADQYYILRGSIGCVRERLAAGLSLK